MWDVMEVCRLIHFVLLCFIFKKMASSSAGDRASHGLDAEVPDRVAKCLDQAKDYGNGEFKHLRAFKFLHLFSGPRDVLGEALKVECDKERLQLEVISFDKSISDSHDLASEQPFGEILEKSKQHGFDGGHERHYQQVGIDLERKGGWNRQKTGHNRPP